MTERLTGGLSRTIMVSFVLLIALYGFFFLRFDTILDDSIFPGAVYRPLRIDTESDALWAYSAKIPYGTWSDTLLSALVIPSDRTPAKALLYAHWNGEWLSFIQDDMRVFRDFGYTVIAYDYPGYGESTGKANPTNFRIAAETMADYVRETLGFDPASTVYGGYSLGTAATLISTMHTIPSRVFLLAPFTSDREIARYYAGFDVYRAFARASEIEPIRMAPMLDIPVLVAHGKFDRTVPYEQGRRLFEVFPWNDKTFVTLSDGTTHFFELTDEPLYSELQKFLSADN